MRPWLISVCALMCLAETRADIELIGTAAIPGTATDRSGLQGSAADGTPADRLGGFGSAIDYTGRDNLYMTCSDRGPSDGAVRFDCRMHTFRITIDAAVSERVRVELVATHLLRDEHGQPLTGWVGEVDPADGFASPRFDPEGLRVLPDGEVLICDEYGPRIDVFSDAGTRSRQLHVPEAFRVRHASSVPSAELPQSNTAGRQPNRGFEGLTLSRDGSTLWAMPQSPLLQDSALSSVGQRVGVNIRVLETRLDGAKAREWVYTLDAPSNGVSEILSVGDRTLVALERDGKGGSKAAFKRLILTEFAGATDVTGVTALPERDLPSAVVPARKRLLLDLLDPRLGLGGASMPEKVEGLCFGPDLSDGRRTLIVTTDNDFLADQPSLVWVFALSEEDLRGRASP